MKSWILLCGIPALAACATMESVEPRIEIVDRPPIQATARVEVGETVLEKGGRSTYDGLKLNNELTWGDGLILRKFTMSPGRLQAKQRDADHVYFYSDKLKYFDALKGEQSYPAGGLCTRTADPSYVRVFVDVGRCFITPGTKPDVEPIRIADDEAAHFRQELIYTGRSGEAVKLLYREYSGEAGQPPLSQDVQYDLKDGKVVGFKGARIEIIEVTNTTLSYRVLASFSDAQ